MDFLFVLTRIGFPIMIVVGGIAAWKLAKGDGPNGEKQTWKDTSLDDWRKERDSLAEAKRGNHATAPDADGDEGATEEQEGTRKHQRIGG
jgi:hypothetical protein